MTRLLVVDDHEIVRAGVKQLLSEHEEFTVAGEAATGADAIKMVREAHWDVVLLDISMSDMDGIETLTHIKRIKPEQPVLILTMHPEDHYAVNLLRAGANGYLCKDCSAEMLVGAIKTVASGRRFISPALGDRLAEELDGERPKEPHTILSKREFQIFCKLAAGQAVSQIADELFLSVKTVSTFRTRILEKMRIKTNAHITYYAIRHGLIE